MWSIPFPTRGMVTSRAGPVRARKMHTTNDIRFPQNGMTAPRTISRRELAQRLLSGLAAGILSPLSSSAHPIHKHLLNGSLLDFADVHLAAGTAKPLFLS